MSSAYRLSLHATSHHQSSCSAFSTDWNIIWDCSIPPKVKIFVWQLCHNALATGKNVAKRGIRLHDICLSCHSSPEDDVHLFLTCDYEKPVWSELDFHLYALISKATSWLHLFHVFVSESPGQMEDLQKFIMCLWGLWLVQNQLVFSGTSWTTKATIEKALCFLQAFQRQHQESIMPSVDSQKSHLKWLPPEPGWIMLNTNAAY